MQYGFVVLAWLFMSGTAPVPFASMEACAVAGKHLGGKWACVDTGVVANAEASAEAVGDMMRQLMDGANQRQDQRR
jgi:hypothetical protein